MTGLRDIDVIVFDVLGTLVDEPSGLRAGIREAVPDAKAPEVEELLATWQRRVEGE
jgi:2-haloacid dehalogenase